MFFDYLPVGGFICGHRGARSIAPENTLLSMVKAMECGAHCLETDVRMSKDGELVIFHDNTLARTTDVADRPEFQAMRPWRTGLFTAAQLEQLDCGSWFLRDDPFGTVESGEVPREEYDTIRRQKIPLLTDLLHFSRKNSYPVNLEIKDCGDPPGKTEIVDLVLDMLAATQTMDLVLLSSFREEYLRRSLALNPHVSIAVLAEKQHHSDLLTYLKSFPACAYHPHEKLCTKEIIHRVQGAGIRVNCWTVNDRNWAGELLRSGVGVITDRPQRLVAG